MREFRYINGPAPRTVKNVLENHFGFSKRTVSRLKLTGGIRVNGEHATVRKELLENDMLTICIEDEKSDNIVPVKMNIDILYEDEDILAVSKPSGLPTHPSLNHYEDTLANGVCYMYRDRNFTFRAVNRLDKDTSGIVLIAKNSNSAHKMSEQIKSGKVRKVYYALCEGILSENSGEICLPIARENESMITRCVSENGKYALTKYKVLKEKENLSLLEVFPVTGRTHQIRVHLSYCGHPIVGDFLYGHKNEGERLMLHCGKMVVKHPVSGEEIEIISELPEYFL